MNKKGFTLIELLTTLVLLGIIAGITIVVVGGNLGTAKENSEEVFIKTLKDAVNIYIETDGKNLAYDTCAKKISKSTGDVSVYKATITFDDIINSSYKPLNKDDLVNPVTNAVCSSDTVITIYRDSDYVYYYSFVLGCLDNKKITNLPDTEGSC